MNLEILSLYGNISKREMVEFQEMLRDFVADWVQHGFLMTESPTVDTLRSVLNLRLSGELLDHCIHCVDTQPVQGIFPIGYFHDLRLSEEKRQLVESVSEALVIEIVELANLESVLDRCEIITRQNIYCAIQKDVELSKAFRKYVYRLYQPTIPNYAFQNLVKEVSSVKISHKGVKLLQKIVEEEIIELAKSAKRICVHAGRVKVSADDFNIALEGFLKWNR